MGRLERGVALVQILIISLVLTSLGIFVSQTVSKQVETAEKVKAAFELQLQLERGEARLLQSLLSNQFIRDPKSLDPFVSNWNFHGAAFSVDSDITYEIQDLSALLSVNRLFEPTARQLLYDLKISRENVDNFIDSLLDWVDKDNNAARNGAEVSYYSSKGIIGPRNGYIQSMDEISYIKGAEAIPKEVLERYFSIELTSGFNPMNAPDIVMNAFIRNASASNQVIQLRDSGKLDRYQFYLLTGREDDEFLTFSPGSKLRIKVIAKSQEQTISKQFIASFTPRDFRQPISITSVRWN